MTGFFPVLLNVRGRLCVVIGGGDVAGRKINTLLERGAVVKVIAPMVRSDIAALADRGAIDLEPRGYQAGDLASAFLCVAAADDPEVNAAVRHEAGVRRVLVNVVDDPEGSDYQVPSFFENGPLLIALGTSGSSPAVARTLRRMIQEWLGDSFEEALAIVERFRERVRAEIEDPKERVRFWEEAITAETLERVRAGDLAGFEESLEAALLEFQR
jgi:precorrin-2 dehydrogenase/sirohydrochlorin ferrochelatase